MKLYPLILLISFLIQGCASGPRSSAGQVWDDYGGVVQTTVKDYDHGMFNGQETTKHPLLINGWQRPRFTYLRVEPTGHLIFGHFDRKPDEPIYESNSEHIEISRNAVRELIETATLNTLDQLGFSIRYSKDNIPIPMAGVDRLKAYAIESEDHDCPISAECGVLIRYSTAWPGTGEPGWKGHMNGGANSSHRVIDVDRDVFVAFTQTKPTDFDQRIFYTELSKQLPETIYLFLNANEYAYVQVDRDEVVSYPFILNQGNVMTFERPESTSSN